MKKPLIILVVLAIATTAIFSLSSFKSSKQSATEYMTITTIESLIPMGLGRSKMIISTVDGSQDLKMLNFFSGVGINFQNITQNSEDINEKLNYYAAEGWELESTSTGVQSSGDGVAGIFISRYVLAKETEE